MSGKIVGSLHGLAHTARRMSDIPSDELSELADYLARSSRLTHGEACRVIQEVLGYFDELPEQFVQRRHLQLQAQGLGNGEIFARLAAELRQRRFCAPNYSARQIRRIIYG
jgi:hypothetical protein